MRVIWCIFLSTQIFFLANSLSLPGSSVRSRIQLSASEPASAGFHERANCPSAMSSKVASEPMKPWFFTCVPRRRTRWKPGKKAYITSRLSVSMPMPLMSPGAVKRTRRFSSPREMVVKLYWRPEVWPGSRMVMVASVERSL